MAPKSKSDFERNALMQLGLPLMEEVRSADKQFPIDHYGDLAQCLNNLISSKKLNEYQEKRLPRAIEEFSNFQNHPPNPIDANTAEQWVNWLKTLDPIVAILEEKHAQKEANQANASPLLKFYAKISEIDELNSLSESKGIREIDLATIGKSPPSTNGLRSDALLAFALPRGVGKTGKASYRILFTIHLSPSQNPQFKGLLLPTNKSSMTFAVSEFIDVEGEPIGNFNLETMTTCSSREWLPESLLDWDQFIGEMNQRCLDIFNAPLYEFAQSIFGNDKRNLVALIIDDENAQKGMWSKVFQKVIHGEIKSKLIDLALSGSSKRQPIRSETAPRELFLGHMDSRGENGFGRATPYPLDPTQRLAAMYGSTLDTQSGNSILPINGPPGTGKTSFLKSMLASKWVAAAKDQLPYPPIVVGTGATNNAVKNIIKAFSEVPGLDDGTIYSRWIDDLPSYGWFYPSKEEGAENPDLMQIGWSDQQKNKYSPMASAGNLLNVPIESRLETYLLRAKKALDCPSSKEPDIAQIISMLHSKIEKKVQDLHSEQEEFKQIVERIGAAWLASKRLCGRTIAIEISIPSIKQAIDQIAQTTQIYKRAIESGSTSLSQSKKLRGGWRSWVPQLFSKELANLTSLQQQSKELFNAIKIEWQEDLLVMPLLLTEAKEQLSALSTQKALLETELANMGKERQSLIDARNKRRSEFAKLAALLRLPITTIHQAKPLIKAIENLTQDNQSLRDEGADQLWALFDAKQDIYDRLELFHLAARYWEGRWIDARLNSSPTEDDQTRIKQLMMLGVIIVGTVYKIGALCQEVQSDLMIMDEAGQCAPQVAVALLAFTKSAIFVGDVKQLPPVTGITMDVVTREAISCGLEVKDLPAQVCPKRGSAMSMAKRSCHVDDGIEDGGVTLLFHYRCHPSIIGYSNRFFYNKKITVVRPNAPTLSGLPPMAWVGVSGTPIQTDGSWINEFEAREITQWILQNHEILVERYQKPLNEILAVITPLKAQAKHLQESLKKALTGHLDAKVINSLIVGTVHRLQGAERPIVIFSLVQNALSNTSLFADRDGGYIVNVAVSRAKDSFIIFGDRATIKPAPADDQNNRIGQGAIAKLGFYLRNHGERLYPRCLVIVEAPGKVDKIQEILGMNVQVIATKGNIKNSHLLANGQLEWGEPNAELVRAIAAHSGLLNTLYIATDDDIAGELIGMHAAQIASHCLDGNVKVRRMRFHSLDAKELNIAFNCAGNNFDANYLAAALVREYARQIDRQTFEQALPQEDYMNPQLRDALAIAQEMTQGDQVHVQARIQDGQGLPLTTFVPQTQGVISPPKEFTQIEAEKIAKQLMNRRADIVGQKTIKQMPALYPSSTTYRMLAVAADELNISPKEAQEHLNALYQDGAQ